jgi:hypothetical protein
LTKTQKSDLTLKIVRLLRSTKTPMTAYAIAKKLQRYFSAIHYHLRKMEAEGMIIHVSEGYVLIPVLYDPLLVEAVYAVLTPYVKDAAKKCESSSQLLNVLKIAVALFIDDLNTKKI